MFRYSSIDLQSLPLDLLPLTKEHLRIDYDDEDASLTQYIGNAIQIVEDVWGQRINPVSITWTPILDDTSYSYKTPIQPVTNIAVYSEGVKQDGYSIYNESRAGSWYVEKDDQTAWPADATVTMDSGFLSVYDIPPVYLGPILRVTGTLYERRETITTPLILVPYWLNDLIVGNWVPRV